MSIKQEFKKMVETITDPMAYLTENWNESEIRDAEIVDPDPVPDIYVPKTDDEKMAPAISAFKAIDRDTQEKFFAKLVRQFKKHEPQVLNFILDRCGYIPKPVVESVLMPQEDVVSPEPVTGQENVETQPEKSFRDRVEELKNEIEDKKGTGTPEEEKAWDDITSAFDLIAHHLDDIQEDEQAPEADQSEIERHPAI